MLNIFSHNYRPFILCLLITLCSFLSLIYWLGVSRFFSCLRVIHSVMTILLQMYKQYRVSLSITFSFSSLCTCIYVRGVHSCVETWGWHQVSSWITVHWAQSLPLQRVWLADLLWRQAYWLYLLLVWKQFWLHWMGFEELSVFQVFWKISVKVGTNSS